MQPRRPYVNIALTVLATAFMIVGLFRVEIDASIGTMLVTGDPAYEAHDDYKTWFGSDEVLSVAIPFADSLTVEALILQREIVRDLETIDGVVEVTALVSQDDVVGDGDSLDVLPLIPDNIRSFLEDDRAKDRLRNRVHDHPVWPGWLISESFGAVAFQVRLDDSSDGELYRDLTMERIDSVLKSALSEGGYFLAGHPFMKSEIARSIANDLSRLLPIAFLVMTVLLLIATRSLYVGGVTALSVLLAVIWMVGSMGWLGMGMTALTNTAPTILVALATACFLHFTAAYQSVSASGNSEAVEIALAGVLPPTWIASVTTALGYASLSLSSVPIVKEFGLALAVGVIGTAVLATYFLPAMLSVSPGARKEFRFAQGYGLGVFLFGVARFVSRFARPILIIGFAFGAFMVVTALQIRVDSSGPRRFDEDSRFRVASRFYRSQLSGDVLESVYLRGDAGDFLDPELLRRLQQFKAAALELPAVDKVVSIADHIGRTYWTFRGETGDPSMLPESTKAVSQLLLLYESSGELGDIANYVSADHSMVRIMLKADVQSSSASSQLKSDLSAIATRLMPEYTSEHSVVSTEMLLSQAADVIAVEQLRSAALALVMVLIVIAASFRSFSAAGVVVLPNVLPIVTNLGMMTLVGVALSDATSIISATAIGIAVDSSVHLLSSMREAERSMSSRRAAVLYALVTTGRPVVVSSLVVVLGFSFLLLSDFGSVAELGILTALTMIYCLATDLLVLPAQLLVSKRCRDEPDPFVLNCNGKTVIASGVQDGTGEWVFTGYCDGSERAINSREVWGISRVGLDGREYLPADRTF